MTPSGAAPTTAEAEKIVLAIGTSKGVAQVENNIVPAKAEAESKFYFGTARRHAVEERGNTIRTRQGR